MSMILIGQLPVHSGSWGGNLLIQNPLFERIILDGKKEEDQKMKHDFVTPRTLGF